MSKEEECKKFVEGNDQKVVIEDEKGRRFYIKENQVARLTMMRQMSWYVISLVIYLGCALFGFGIAYLVIRILIFYELT